jgi:predicted outer membrane repeat protein
VSATPYTVKPGTPIPVTQSINIAGAAAATTVLDGGGATCLFEVGQVLQTSVTISGLTLAHANGAGCTSGGAIQVTTTGTVLTVADVTFSNDAAGGGFGGAINAQGNLIVHDSTFSADTATNAGGALFANGTMKISGSTFSSNTGGSAGGAIFTNQLINVSDSTFTGNVAASGAGIFSNGQVEVTGATLSGNRASSSGGALFANGSLTLQASALDGNSAATSGGAVYTQKPTTIQATTMSSNTAAIGQAGFGAGGALFTAAPTTIGASTFDHNTAGSAGGSGDGGAVRNNAALTMVNSTISANAADVGGSGGGSGGGLYVGGNATLTNVTLAGNGAATSGGGLFLESSQTATLENDIIAGGSAPSGASCFAQTNGTFSSAGHNLEETTPSQCGLNASGDQFGADPLLGPLQANGGPTQTQALAPRSPAIDHGDNSGCPATDQRGVLRPQGAACDIGAYESARPSVATSPATGIGAATVTLNGQASNPDVVGGAVYFQYGSTASYGSQTSSQALGAGAGSTGFAASLSGLSPGTTYHFRAVAVNPDRTVYGEDQVFSTLALSISAQPPVLVPVPVLSALTLSPRSFSLAGRKVGRRCVKPTKKSKRRPACTLPVKLAISYTLNTATTVTFRISGTLPGRKVAGRCAMQTRKNRTQKKCARRVTLPGSTVQAGKAGANSLLLGPKLGPGSYTLTATPTGGLPERITFKIIS